MILQVFNDPHPVLKYSTYRAVHKCSTYIYIDKEPGDNVKVYQYTIYGYFNTFDIKKFLQPNFTYAASIKTAGEDYDHDPGRDLIMVEKENGTVSFLRKIQLSNVYKRKELDERHYFMQKLKNQVKGGKPFKHFMTLSPSREGEMAFQIAYSSVSGLSFR